MADFRKSPAYQRREQRLRRKMGDMPAGERTMLNALAAEIGGEEMRKKVSAIQLAGDREARKANLKLGERRLGLKRRKFEFEKEQILPATLVGLGEVGLGVYGGMEQKKTSQEMARFLLSQKGQYTPKQEPYMRRYWRNP